MIKLIIFIILLGKNLINMWKNNKNVSKIENELLVKMSVLFYNNKNSNN